MAATTISTIPLNPKCILTSSSSSRKPHLTNLPSKSDKPVSLNLPIPKSLTSSTLAGTTIAGAVFSTLSSCDPEMAAQQLSLLAGDGENRGLDLLLSIVPALAWVLFNILQPALNQINKMTAKGVIIGLGLSSGLGLGGGFLSTPHSVAAEAAAGSDNWGQLLLFVVAPAILWVLYNILQPALNQINKMRS